MGTVMFDRYAIRIKKRSRRACVWDERLEVYSRLPFKGAFVHAAVSADGSYVAFLTKDKYGAHWLHIYRRRSKWRGWRVELIRGLAVNASEVYWHNHLHTKTLSVVTTDFRGIEFHNPCGQWKEVV